MAESRQPKAPREPISSATQFSQLEADPKWLQIYDSTDQIWLKILSANPELKDGEKFFRTFVTAVRSTGRVEAFAEAFAAKIGDRKNRTICSDFLLCSESVLAGFIFSEPPSLTDILRYTFDGTCFGHLPDSAHQLVALQLTDAVVAKIGVKEIASLSNFNDLDFWRHRMSDILAGAGHHWSTENKRGEFRHIRAVIAELPTDKGKPGKGSGRNRSPALAAQDAAFSACKGH